MTDRLPRVCHGLVSVTAGNTLLIDGGPQRRQLSGASAVSVLPEVMPLLDGTRGPGLIGQLSGLTSVAVDSVVRLLDGSGLIEWVESDANPPSSADGHISTFFSRNIHGMGACRSAEDVAKTLAEAVVVIVAPEPVSAQIESDLRESGVGTVLVHAGTSAVSAAEKKALAAANAAAIAVLDLGTAIEDAVAAFAGLPVPIVRVAFSEQAIELGPTFFADWGHCVACLRSADDLTVSGADYFAPAAAVAAALTTGDVLSHLLRTDNLRSPWQLRRYTECGQNMESLEVFPDEDCTTCKPATGQNLAWLYEQQHERRPVPLAGQQKSSAEHERRIDALQTSRTALLPGPVHALPSEALAGQGEEADDANGRSGPPGDQLLATLLRVTAGLRSPAGPRPGGKDSGGNRRRWAPTGGNLASVQMYVATSAPRFGLAGCLYRYDDMGHRLEALSSVTVPLRLLTASTDLADAEPDTVLLFVADIGRISRKYHGFAVRLAHLDAGCAALQLTLAAADHGLNVVFASRWGEDVARSLELQSGLELVTAIAAVGPRRSEMSWH